MGVTNEKERKKKKIFLNRRRPTRLESHARHAFLLW